MCFGGGSQPKAPKPVKPISPPMAPPAPAPIVTAPPQDLKIQKQEVIKRNQSSKELSGQVNQGTSQLRVPLNIGAPKSGGINI